MKRLVLVLLGLLVLVSPLQAQPAKQQTKYGRGYVHPSPEVLAKRHAEAFKRHGHRQFFAVRAMTPPTTFDSVTMGWIPPIQDQGNCGDCYGVSASDAFTVAFIKGGYQKADGSFTISAQYGLDCGAYQGGCNGGDGPQVYDWAKSTGFPAEKYIDSGGNSVSDYPGYTANPGRCRTAANAKMWKPADWLYATSDQSQRAPTVNEVKAGVMGYAVVTFAFDASALDNYNGQPIDRLGGNIDHEITGFCGWDDNKACPDGSKGAFKCRNQWGTSFGDSGYFWLAYTAVPSVVEACCIVATALPPPPPPPPPPAPVPPTPPTPPGPTPIGDISLTLKSDGTYIVTGGVLVRPDMTLKQIVDAYSKPGAAPATAPTTKCDSAAMQKRIDDLETVIRTQTKAIKQLQDVLKGTDKKQSDSRRSRDGWVALAATPELREWRMQRWDKMFPEYASVP